MALANKNSHVCPLKFLLIGKVFKGLRVRDYINLRKKNNDLKTLETQNRVKP